MGKSAATVTEFCSAWRVVTLFFLLCVVGMRMFKQKSLTKFFLNEQ